MFSGLVIGDPREWIPRARIPVYPFNFVLLVFFVKKFIYWSFFCFLVIFINYFLDIFEIKIANLQYSQFIYKKIDAYV